MPYKIIEVDEYWRSRPHKKTAAERAMERKRKHGKRRRSRKLQNFGGI